MTQPNRILLAILLSLGGLGIWIALSGEEGESLDTRAELPRGEGPRARATSLEGDGAGGVEREDLKLAPELETVAEHGAPAPEIEVYVTRNLRGSLTLTDEFGNGPFLQNGSFGFWLWEGETASYHEVVVVGGEWETILPDGVRLSLGEVELGGRVAAFEGEDGVPIPIPASGSLDLAAYLPKSTVLRVYGADTGEELNGVTVVVKRGPPVLSRHPGKIGEENKVVEGASSPIPLEALPGIRIDEEVTYYVRAVDYGWAKLRLEHSTGGTYRIRLERAGALRVKLSEFEAGLFPTFRLWQNGRPQLELPLEWERDFKLDSIPAGEYLATVDIGQDWRRKVCLGSSPVTIHAGSETVVELQLESGPKYERQDLTGIVIIPEEWELDSFRLLVRLRGQVASRRESLRVAASVELANVPGRDDAWRFHFPDLIVGVWKIGVEPTLYSKNVLLENEMSEELVIEVPPPARWTIRVVDPHTEELAAIEELRYRTLESYTVQKELAKPGARPGTFEIRAPLGRVALHAIGEGYSTVNRTIMLDAPSGEFVLEVPSFCGVDVSLRSRGGSVGWGEGYVVLVDSKGETVEIGAGFAEESVRLSCDEPGEYELRLLDMEGYQPVPARSVYVEPAKYVQVELELTPN